MPVMQRGDEDVADAAVVYARDLVLRDWRHPVPPSTSLAACAQPEKAGHRRRAACS
jgi:hypothetical protein